jgi:hypothetical protein
VPFTGIYPYGCVLPPDKVLDEKTRTTDLRSLRQAYAELPANRTLGQYKILHQLYAARPDLFPEATGPIVITPSPALVPSTGPMRAPFDHPDGVGRMVAEVLRFLYAHKLTLPATAGALHLRFLGSEVRTVGVRPTLGPLGLPKRTVTTVVTHSAGVGPVLTLAAGAVGRPGFPREFPEALWGGPSPYCRDSWQNLWVIDGVASPGGIGMPREGGPAAATWAAWLKQREGRRMAMTYTPSGLDKPVSGLLVTGATSRSGAAGRIEESAGGRVRWLHMSYSYLKADPAQNPPDVRPGFCLPQDGADPVHNKIYEFGVGYAAAGLR